MAVILDVACGVTHNFESGPILMRVFLSIYAKYIYIGWKKFFTEKTGRNVELLIVM